MSGIVLGVITLAAAAYSAKQQKDAGDEAQDAAEERAANLLESAGSEARALGKGAARLRGSQISGLSANGIQSSTGLGAILGDELVAESLLQIQSVLTGASSSGAALRKQARLEKKIRNDRATAGLITAGVQFFGDNSSAIGAGLTALTTEDEPDQRQMDDLNALQVRRKRSAAIARNREFRANEGPLFQ